MKKFIHSVVILVSVCAVMGCEGKSNGGSQSAVGGAGGERQEGGSGGNISAGGSGGTPRECTAEVCDETDNDCDLVVDEGLDEHFADLGEVCMVGEAQCAREGVKVCSPDGLSVVCGATPGMPTAERCNDIDDDCDGTVDEACACNPLAENNGGPRELQDLEPMSIEYVLDLTGAAQDPAGLDSACAPNPGTTRDEMALIWNPTPGLHRVEVISGDFDPQIYIGGLCPMVAGGQPGPVEQGCVRDSGIARVGNGPNSPVGTVDGDRAAAIVVKVPNPAPGPVGLYVESQSGEGGIFQVEITDPTGARPNEGAACGKELSFGDRDYAGEDICRKRLWNELLFTPAPEADLFTVLPPAAALPAPYASQGDRWDDPRRCIDNDGRALSVDVDWNVLSGDGVEGTLLPAGAERGDWWSTALPAGQGTRLFIAAEPVVENPDDSACAANSLRLVAYLTCTEELVPEMEDPQCEAVTNSELRCDPDNNLARLACREGLANIDGAAPVRKLDILSLLDGGCRDAGDLVLHVGVIREDDATPRDCAACNALTIDPGACFRYRLRVTE